LEKEKLDTMQKMEEVKGKLESVQVTPKLLEEEKKTFQSLQKSSKLKKNIGDLNP
jgi:hypothetical protein